jgi:ankyrin repeat protein
MSTGQLDIAKVLVENGADLKALNNKGRTPLQVAALYSHEDVANYLAQEMETKVPVMKRRSERKIKKLDPPMSPPRPDVV